MKVWGAALLVVVATALAPGTATAATLGTKTENNGHGGDYAVASLVAAPGEKNIVSVIAGGGGMLVTATSGGLTALPGTGCTQQSADTVACAAAVFTYLLGDEDDRIEIAQTGAIVSGSLGPGNDRGIVAGSVYGDTGNDVLSAAAQADRVVLDGGPGDDVATGSPGQDDIRGGGGRDFLFGGAGDDSVDDRDSGTGDADVMDGGAGTDTLSYITRQARVRIDLEAGTAGADGESDVATSFENVDTGAGNDIVFGSSEANRIDAGAGGDYVNARGGKDLVAAGGPGDVLKAGAGDDRVDAGPPSGRYSCGTGVDAVFAAGAFIAPPADCEGVEGFALPLAKRGIVVATAPARTSGRVARFRLKCPEQPIRCSGRLTLKVGGKRIASGVFKAKPGRWTTVVVKGTHSLLGGRRRRTVRLDATALVAGRGSYPADVLAFRTSLRRR